MPFILNPTLLFVDTVCIAFSTAPFRPYITTRLLSIWTCVAGLTLWIKNKGWSSLETEPFLLSPGQDGETPLWFLCAPLCWSLTVGSSVLWWVREVGSLLEVIDTHLLWVIVRLQAWKEEKENIRKMLNGRKDQSIIFLQSESLTLRLCSVTSPALHMFT